MIYRTRAFMIPLIAAIVLAGIMPVNALAQGKAIELRYTGDVDEMLVKGSELFYHEQSDMPGDTFAGSVLIRNESDRPCEMTLRVQNVVASGPDDILQRIPFTMEFGEEVLFEGMLGNVNGERPAEPEDEGDDSPEAADLSEDDEGAFEWEEPVKVFDLGVIEQNEDREVHCTAVIPAELTNRYADVAVDLNLAVTLEKIPEPPVPPEDVSGGNGNGGNGNGYGGGNSNGGDGTNGNNDGSWWADWYGAGLDGEAGAEGKDAASLKLASTASKGTTGAGLARAGDGMVWLPFVLGVIAAAGTVIWCAWKRRTRMW